MSCGALNRETKKASPFFRRLCVGVVLAIVCSACAVNERIAYSDGEGPIPTDVFRLIKKNETDKQWVLAHLGKPTAVESFDPVSYEETPTVYEIYTYQFTRSRISSGHLLFLFRAGQREDETRYFHVAFENDVVVRSWLDRFPSARQHRRS